ncbi:hypothetical protein D9M70_601250 [compost metagenome]
MIPFSMACATSRCQAVSRLDFCSAPPWAATMILRCSGRAGIGIFFLAQIVARTCLAASQAACRRGVQRTMLSRLPLRRLVSTPSGVSFASVRVTVSIPRRRHR